MGAGEVALVFLSGVPASLQSGSVLPSGRKQTSPSDMVTVSPGGGASTVDDGAGGPDVVDGDDGGVLGLDVALGMGVPLALLREVELAGFVMDSRVVPI